MSGEEFKRWIRDVPDFPRRGILFRDITPALKDPAIFRAICDRLVSRYAERSIDAVAGVEARGFFFASVMAYRLGTGLVPLRKPGKLPWETVSKEYELEYGRSGIAMHRDAVARGDRVVLVDDLLATGGTAVAAAGLIEGQGGILEEIAFVIEISALGGREMLGERPIFSLITY